MTKLSLKTKGEFRRNTQGCLSSVRTGEVVYRPAETKEPHPTQKSVCSSEGIKVEVSEHNPAV